MWINIYARWWFSVYLYIKYIVHCIVYITVNTYNRVALPLFPLNRYKCSAINFVLRFDCWTKRTQTHARTSTLRIALFGCWIVDNGCEVHTYQCTAAIRCGTAVNKYVWFFGYAYTIDSMVFPFFFFHSTRQDWSQMVNKNTLWM